MKRFRTLSRYQKGILFAVAAMALVFSAVYPVTMARQGFEYMDVILVPEQENGKTVYSGNIQGKQASFTVYADKRAEFQYGEKVYGPYTVREEPAAIPGDNALGKDMTGIELRCGEEIIFRGGVLRQGDERWLYREDGNLENITISAVISDGTVVDENGNILDPMEPSPWVILELMDGPELTHKGIWAVWGCGVLVCVVTAFSILFADQLFRWRMSLAVRNVEDVEPSAWEMAGRYVAWTALPVMALALFIMGLR